MKDKDSKAYKIGKFIGGVLMATAMVLTVLICLSAVILAVWGSITLVKGVFYGF